MGVIKHYNKIVKIVSGILTVEERIDLIRKYCDRVSMSSDVYRLNFVRDKLTYTRIDSFYKIGKEIEIDLSNLVSISEIRDLKLHKIGI